MRHRKPLTRAGWLVRIAGCAGALIGAVGLAGAVGPSGLSWSALGTDDPVARSILLEVRLPRILLAATLGAALSLAGAIFQALLRNPLADPYVLGVSGGASLGGVLALSLGGSLLGGLGVGVSAFLGALLALWLIATIATRGGRIDVLTLLLTGAIFNAFSGALIFFVQSVASRREVHEIVFFLMGRLPPLRPAALLGLGLIVLAALALASSWGRAFNALTFGEATAQHLGVSVERLKWVSFVLGALLTGLSVAVAGMIGFVGLVVPHLLRMLFGPDHRLLFPASGLVGGAFLVACDGVARIAMAPAELPVGVVTALVGGPFFLLLLRERGRRAGF